MSKTSVVEIETTAWWDSRNVTLDNVLLGLPRIGNAIAGLAEAQQYWHTIR